MTVVCLPARRASALSACVLALGMSIASAPGRAELGVIRGVPETIYQQVDAIRAANGGCN